MCSNCNRNVCGGRGAIAYQNVNDTCECQHNDHFHNNDCGCTNAVNDCGCGNNGYANNGCGCNNNNCGCGCNGIVGSLAKGFACTTNRIVRGLDRSLSCGCGCNNNGCGCGCNNGCGC